VRTTILLLQLQVLQIFWRRSPLAQSLTGTISLMPVTL
jgi:hypothetical protein